MLNIKYVYLVPRTQVYMLYHNDRAYPAYIVHYNHNNT